LRPDMERLGRVLVADAADERAAARVVERENSKEIFESAAEALWSIVLLRVSITELARGGKEHVLAGLHVDATVQPVVIAGELDFLREAFLAVTCGRILRVLRVGCLGPRTFVNELGSKVRWECHCGDGQ